MKTLYLLRHAHATDAAPVPMGDHERTLSPRGIYESESVAAFMQDNGFAPDFVISSSSVRTMQTVRNVFGVLLKEEGQTVRSHFDRGLYLASADALLAQIHAAEQDVEQLLVAGHNPGIAELAYLLSGKTLADFTTDYPTATLCVFNADVDDWHDLTPDKVRLDKIFVPEQE